MTNGDKIRGMTDEELALFLPTGDCFECPVLADREFDNCKECALNWLKEESSF